MGTTDIYTLAQGIVVTQACGLRAYISGKALCYKYYVRLIAWKLLALGDQSPKPTWMHLLEWTNPEDFMENFGYVSLMF